MIQAVVFHPRFALAGRHALSRASRPAATIASHKLPWIDVDDELKNLQRLLQEYKTNKAVPPPSLDLQGQVDQLLQSVTRNGTDHDDAFAMVHRCKTVVKDSLYNNTYNDTRR